MKMKMWLSLVGVLAAGVASAFNVKDLSGSGTVKNESLELENTTVYHVSGTLTYDVSAKPGVSAWKVPQGGTCVINLKPGAELTLKGGNASGATAAGCGIEVPEDATLYITGEGTLNAIGGWAGNGFAGGAGGGGAVRGQDAAVGRNRGAGGKARR